MPFVLVDKVKHGFHTAICAEASLIEPEYQPVLCFIPPTALRHEGIPDQDFFLIGFPSIGKGPIKKLIVAAARECPLPKGIIIDFQKAHAATVESAALVTQLFRVVRRKFSLRMKANLIQHAAKMDDATNHIMGTAETRNVCHAEPYGCRWGTAHTKNWRPLSETASS